MNLKKVSALVLFLMSAACATTGQVVPVEKVTGVPAATAGIHFNIVKGALEPQNSDKVGLHSLMVELAGIYPTATFSEFTQDKFDAEPFKAATVCQYDIGNSWGGAAIMRRLDKNPGAHLAGAALIDPVPNRLNQPKQDQDQITNGWAKRNIGFVTLLRETESILRGTGLKLASGATGTFTRNDADHHSRYDYPGIGSEYVLDWNVESGMLGDINAHFQILTKHEWAKKVVLDAIARAVESCKVAQ